MHFDLKTALVTVLACALVLALANGPRAEAQKPSSGASSGGGGDASRDLIAVTGSYGSGASVLYLIDVKTRHMCVYRSDNGRKLEFVAARDVTYDLKLESLNDESPVGFSPAELRRHWMQSRGSGAESRPEETRTTADQPGGR